MALWYVALIICGGCFAIGFPWAYISNIRECGFDPSCIIVFPFVVALTAVGAFLVLIGITGLAS